MKNKFRMIACSDKEVYALDENGQVWEYVPSKDAKPPKGKPKPPQEESYAFWARLTNRRAAGEG